MDLSLNQRAAEPVDWEQPRPVVELPGADPLPRFALYPLPEQMADKLCAMYGRYRDMPSSRYRDLVDLTLIVTTHELDAAQTLRALRGEAGRRGIELPDALTSPGPSWSHGYRGSAVETSLDPELQSLDAALSLVGHCLGPLLAGARTTGRWNPTQLAWDDTVEHRLDGLTSR
ncbi:nucleotidyl transferase AbiEii/AbiGii toxin family protein [Kribbella sp. NPDC004536]|uniref:nucleotidyl transferase AbiEii/AbiGii toxin family protein n=1 Tax=Kribbella sp. NPDC004536 TaxID=3364106 RepID=UPI0036A28CA6